MRRARDFFGFALLFAGFGYLTLWPIGWSSLIVSPAWRMAGVAAAAFAVVGLLLYLRGRRRRKVARPPARVKPRAHFGLRGKPH